MKAPLLLLDVLADVKRSPRSASPTSLPAAGRRGQAGARRARHPVEFLDAGMFDEDRYFDIEIEYAKENAEDIVMRVRAHNRGPEAAPLHILPHLWFRNTWSWTQIAQPQPRIIPGASGPGARSPLGGLSRPTLGGARAPLGARAGVAASPPSAASPADAADATPEAATSPDSGAHRSVAAKAAPLAKPPLGGGRAPLGALSRPTLGGPRAATPRAPAPRLPSLSRAVPSSPSVAVPIEAEQEAEVPPSFASPVESDEAQGAAPTGDEAAPDAPLVAAAESTAPALADAVGLAETNQAERRSDVDRIADTSTSDEPTLGAVLPFGETALGSEEPELNMRGPSLDALGPLPAEPPNRVARRRFNTTDDDVSYFSFGMTTNHRNPTQQCTHERNDKPPGVLQPGPPRLTNSARQPKLDWWRREIYEQHPPFARTRWS